ncbi:hypothetical protein CK203_086054 [Vitis vinifera]|uniref:Uncharacterized protein n=1 Tax=Vitis vinifera TaxID=29760 RepID=A0A438D5C9_VITVI|nr:hypothetical protein CK203_086054 [Vitis vinifera]
MLSQEVVDKLKYKLSIQVAKERSQPLLPKGIETLMRDKVEVFPTDLPEVSSNKLLVRYETLLILASRLCLEAVLLSIVKGHLQ